MKKYKGALVYIYKSPHGDCTNGGISSGKTQLILVGDGIPETFEGDDTNTVKLVRRNIGGREYLHAEPVVQPEGLVGPMAGGNFIYTSDSRFPNKYPISIHDRFETQEMYNHLSK